MSQELFAVLSLAAGTGCLVTLFVAAHLSWVEKQRRRSWKTDRAQGASPRAETVKRGCGCGRFKATA